MLQASPVRSAAAEKAQDYYNRYGKEIPARQDYGNRSIGDRNDSGERSLYSNDGFDNTLVYSEDKAKIPFYDVSGRIKDINERLKYSASKESKNKALYNIGAMGSGFAYGFTNPLFHPIKTAKSIGSFGYSLLTKPSETFAGIGEEI
jgi:hypothetical protein